MITKSLDRLYLNGLTPEENAALLPPNAHVILLGYRGSISHGMYRNPVHDAEAIDDKDLLGVAIGPLETYFGLANFEQHEKMLKEWDVVIYEVRKYVRLLCQANPNVLSLLWLEPHHYIVQTEKGARLIAARDLFMTRRLYQSFAGYAHSQLKRMTHHTYQGYMGERRKAIVDKYGYDCYDDLSTEFLTLRGWQRYDSIHASDKLATVASSGVLEWQSYIQRISKEYTGNLWTIASRGTRAVVTATHNLLVSPAHRSPANRFSAEYDKRTASWALQSVESIMQGRRSVYHLRVAAEPRTRKLLSVEDEYLILLGLYVSDGTSQFRKDNFRGIRLTQRKDGPFWLLADQVQQKFGGNRYDYSKETIWDFGGPVAQRVYDDVGHYERLKALPLWTLRLSTDQVETLWSAMMAGDGYAGPKTHAYYTSSVSLASTTHAMLTSAGIHSVVGGPYEYLGISNFGPRPPMWQVRRSMIDFSQFRPWYSRSAFSECEPVVDRRVVCFEVPNGTLITRSQGHPAIHGNCKNAQHLIRLLRMGAEALVTGQFNVHRHDAAQLMEIKMGQWTLEQVKAEADHLFKRIEAAYDTCKLPLTPDRDVVNKLLVNLLHDHFE